MDAGWVVPVDGRDGFITWLRGEFAAANAIIDLLLAHLRAAAGDPAAEYEPIAAAVHRRRHHWAPVVHLQHHFPVADVALALHHAAAGHQRAAPPPRRYGGHAHQRPAPIRTAGSKRDGGVVLSRDGKDVKEVETLAEATKSSKLDCRVTNGTEAHPQKANSKMFSTPTGYVVNEVIDGKTVNVVEGLKLYEGFVDVTEVGRILSVVNDVKATRNQGGLEEVKVDPVPGLLHDRFDRLVQQKVVPAKPDYCVIDFFNEGGYSHPHHSPPWYGRPFCTLCLTDCDMVFGLVIPGDSRGDHKGSLKLSFSTGSLLVLEGRSADIAKRALSATSKQRILLSFGKSVARKHAQSEFRKHHAYHSPVNTSSHALGCTIKAGEHHVSPLES